MNDRSLCPFSLVEALPFLLSLPTSLYNFSRFAEGRGERGGGGRLRLSNFLSKFFNFLSRGERRRGSPKRNGSWISPVRHWGGEKKKGKILDLEGEAASLLNTFYQGREKGRKKGKKSSPAQGPWSKILVAIIKEGGKKGRGLDVPRPLLKRHCGTQALGGRGRGGKKQEQFRRRIA